MARGRAPDPTRQTRIADGAHVVVRGNHYSVEDYLPDEHAYRLADPRGTHTIPAAQVERANGQAPRVPIPPKPTP